MLCVLVFFFIVYFGSDVYFVNVISVTCIVPRIFYILNVLCFTLFSV
jgi:hypothetical protein